jgi:ATP-dependent Clp protease adapter protein ClpS
MDSRVRSRSIPQLPSSMGAAYGGVVFAAGSCETDAVVDVSIPVEAAPQEQVDEVVETQRPWITIVWNDPINLMSYVTYVFMTYFHFSRDKAEKLMNDVHHEGRGWSRLAREKKWNVTSVPCTPTACGPRFNETTDEQRR